MNSTAVEIGQAIGGYAALLAAIVAGIAVLITYRLRPLRMRSIELHSKHLKETIEKWLSEMTGPDSPAHAAHISKTHGYIEIEQVREPESYGLALENDILFRDLSNHLPSSIFERWSKYKKNRDNYLQAKRQLTESVFLLATTATGLRIYDGSGSLPSEDVLFDDAVNCLFDDLDRIARGENPYWFVPELASSNTEVPFEQGVLQRGAYGLIWCSSETSDDRGSGHERSESRCREIYAQLSRALREAVDLIKGLNEHREQFDTLYQTQQNLEADLSGWLKVPILPKECDLLKKGAR